jgi:hypothetical protein
MRAPLRMTAALAQVEKIRKMQVYEGLRESG